MLHAGETLTTTDLRTLLSSMALVTKDLIFNSSLSMKGNGDSGGSPIILSLLNLLITALGVHHGEIMIMTAISSFSLPVLIILTICFSGITETEPLHKLQMVRL